MAGEVRRTCSRAFFPIRCCGPNAHHCAVGASVPQPVDNQPVLCPVFARNNAPACLIPIKNHVSVRALLHQIFVHKHGTAIRGANLDLRGAHGFPSAAWKAVLGRMDPLTGTLIFVVANVEFDRRCSSGIHSIDVIIRSDRFHNFSLVRKILAVPQGDSGRKVTQRPMRLRDVRRRDAMRREDPLQERAPQRRVVETSSMHRS